MFLAASFTIAKGGGEDNPKGHYQMNVIIQTKCGIMYIGMLVLKKKKILTHATNE